MRPDMLLNPPVFSELGHDRDHGLLLILLLYKVGEGGGENLEIILFRERNNKMNNFGLVLIMMMEHNNNKNIHSYF